MRCPDLLKEQAKQKQTRKKASLKVMAVFVLTLITMIVEIAVGMWSGSMALLADGWHMGTHAAAFLITLFVYWYASKHADNPRFSFGTGKVEYLGGFASAVALAMVALMMAIESVERLLNPTGIHFYEAIGVAFIGLVVNVVSVFLLHDDHHNHHHHDHDHDHGQDGHRKYKHSDHNLKAAYFHVLADALTSVLAIVALFAGLYFGWLWTDALMGIVGALIISKWAWGLIKESSEVLLDNNLPNTQQLITKLEQEFDLKVLDLHLWRLSQSQLSLMAHLTADQEIDCAMVKAFIKKEIPEVQHVNLQKSQGHHSESCA